MSSGHNLHAVLRDWASAERKGDTAALDTLLAPDFAAIGPLGFTLTKNDWLERHSTAALSYDRFELDEVELRMYGDAAVALARQAGAGAYNGVAVPEALRMSVVLTRTTGTWQLALVHMSF